MWTLQAFTPLHVNRLREWFQFKGMKNKVCLDSEYIEVWGKFSFVEFILQVSDIILFVAYRSRF